MLAGASKQRAWWMELALFTAWHAAAFSRQERLRPWHLIRQELRMPAPAQPTTRQSWEMQKLIVLDFVQKHRKPVS